MNKVEYVDELPKILEGNKKYISDDNIWWTNDEGKVVMSLYTGPDLFAVDKFEEVADE